MPPRKPSSARAGVTSVTRSVAMSSTDPDAEARRPATRQARMTTSVTAGPATATLNSRPGVSGSRPSLARPPKNHRSMPMIGMS